MEQATDRGKASTPRATLASSPTEPVHRDVLIARQLPARVGLDDALVLSEDAELVNTNEGVWCAAANSSFTLRGKAAQQLLATLIPRLDGMTSLRRLLEECTDERLEATLRVISALVDRTVLVCAGPAQSSVTDRITSAHVRILGGTDWTRALKASWLESGAAVPTIDTVTDLATTSPIGAAPDRRVDVLIVQVAAFDSDHWDDVETRAMEIAHRAIFVGEHAGTTWLLVRDENSACWSCANDAIRAVDTSSSAPMSDTADSSWRLATVQLAGEILAAARSAAVLRSVDASDGSSADHESFSQPGCRCLLENRCAPYVLGTALIRRNITRPDYDPRLDAVNDHIVNASERWTDTRLGPCLSLDGGMLAQVPLGNAAADFVSRRMGRLTVSSTALSTREAYHQAMLSGLEQLSSAETDDSVGILSAGWTLDEAIYRAITRNTLQRVIHHTEPTAVHARSPRSDECRDAADYLESVLATRSTWTFGRTANGLVSAVGTSPALPLLCGVGFCADEARGSALLNDGCSPASFIPFMPHPARWHEVWATIRLPETINDLTQLVPFAEGAGHLVSVAEPSHAAEHTRRAHD